ILYVMFKMATCPSSGAGVGQSHRPHLQSPNRGLVSLSRKSSWSVQTQPTFVDFDSLHFLGCNRVVVSLHATVAPSSLNRRTHLGRYSLKRDEPTVALRAAADCQRPAGKGVEVHGRALGNFRRSSTGGLRRLH